MLIGAESEAFDSPDYLFELKIDGVRSLAYLEDGTILKNKRNLNVSGRYPELENINRQIRYPCILDGEITAIVEGKPCFAKMQRRSILSDPFKIKLAAAQHPVCLIAFDLLWLDGSDMTGEPIERRKALLAETVREESPFLAISRTIPEKGKALYALTEKQKLEGIVGKKLGSFYYPGKRTKNWVKIKRYMDEDFVVCGYIRKPGGMTSLILGQYQDDTLVYKGHVTLGVSGGNYAKVTRMSKRSRPPFLAPAGNEEAVWIDPELVCTVVFMEKNESGSMRQPVFRGIRDDKAPRECIADE